MSPLLDHFFFSRKIKPCNGPEQIPFESNWVWMMTVAASVVHFWELQPSECTNVPPLLSLRVISGLDSTLLAAAAAAAEEEGREASIGGTDQFTN